MMAQTTESRRLRIDLVRSLRCALVVVGVLVVARGAAHAQPSAEDLEVREFDTIYEKGKPPALGTIIETTPKRIQFRPKGRKLAYFIDRDEIERIVERRTPDDVYHARQLRLDEQSAQQQFELAQFCLKWKLADRARHHLERSNALDPTRREIYDLLVADYEQRPLAQIGIERKDVRIGVYARGLRAGIEDPRFALESAAILESIDDAAGAIRMLEAALEFGLQGEQLADAENRMAVLLERTGRREEAKAFVDQILKGDPDRGAKLLQLRLAWQLESVAAGDAGAQDAFDETVKAILSSDPNNGEARLYRACARLIGGDYAAADKSFVAALSAGPSPQLSLCFALNAAHLGKVNTARSLLATVKSLAASDPKIGQAYQLVRSYVHEVEGDPAQAWDALTDAINEASTWQTWIVYLQRLARLNPSNVDDAAGQFLDNFGDNPVAFGECAALLGHHALARGDSAKARRWLAYAEQVRPDDAEVLRLVGVANLAADGSLEVAKRALTKAYAIDAGNLDLHNALGCVAYRSGDYAQAKRMFDGVVAKFDPKVIDAIDPPATAAYALAALRRIDAVQNEERWVDAFDRDEPTIINNWELENRFGIALSQDGGTALFDGTQASNSEDANEGLTLFSRPESDANFSRIRARFKLEAGADAVRVGLRLESKDASEGVVFYRSPDGVLAFAINSGDSTETFHPPTEDTQHDLREFRWPDDGEYHRLEIRINRDRSDSVELYFDDQCVARNIRNIRHRGGVRVGASGQAPSGSRYRVRVDDFEIFRRKQKTSTSTRK